MSTYKKVGTKLCFEKHSILLDSLKMCLYIKENKYKTYSAIDNLFDKTSSPLHNVSNNSPQGGIIGKS